MLRKEQIEYALRYAEDPVEWVFELVRGLEKRIDELVKNGTKVTVFQEHWHPASEPPEYAQEVIVLFKHGAYHDYPLIPMKFKYLGKWFMDVKWWCYPPKEGGAQ